MKTFKQFETFFSKILSQSTLMYKIVLIFTTKLLELYIQYNIPSVQSELPNDSTFF